GPVGHAAAVCGDVTGDDEVLASDALAVLREAVGIEADLECTAEPVIAVNTMGFANTIACGGVAVVAEMTWTEHTQFRWQSETKPLSEIESDFFRVDDLFVGGKIEIDYAACGSIEFDIGGAGVVYPMPAVGGATMFPLFDDATSSVLLFLDINFVDSSFEGRGASDVTDVTDLTGVQRFALGSVPAPPGLSDAR
ncbi:MAG: hypothetical protein ACI8TX_003652, partial [Hyphomicrobiaceae bacterium]